MAELTSNFRLDNNELTADIPTEFGNMEAMKAQFYLSSNDLCNDIPTELILLSNSVSGYYVTSGNDLGTCCFCMDFVDDLDSNTVTLDYSGLGKTGPIPTEFGKLTAATALDLR